MPSINEKITEEIRKLASSLLDSGTVAAFLGFTKGTLPGRMQPFVARKPEDAQKLHWNSFCVVNLANYLPALLKSFEPPRRPNDPPPEGPLPKVGVLATGCWSRNMVVQIQENQIDRDRVVIVGISSRGMVDRKKLLEKVGGREITSIDEDDHSLTVTGQGFEEKINRWDVVRDNCQTCVHPDPVIYDELIGELGGERKIPDRFRQVDEIEALSIDERWSWFQNEISSCIRCYACRNACPLCYCPTCFVDDSRPQWVGKSIDKVDTALFHILRAYHCAGRCTDCGSCESVCPMGIRMRLFTKKLQKDVLELYDFEPGLDLETPLPLSTYRMDDPQDFILTHIKKGEEK
ncbi:MAG: 4Fe-4S ferredoxin [Thermodesulfobacteria bacterium]|nr:4Fe-4S ferredoxin [Thermodesulfobacteriota bacterium]